MRSAIQMTRSVSQGARAPHVSGAHHAVVQADDLDPPMNPYLPSAVTASVWSCPDLAPNPGSSIFQGCHPGPRFPLV